MPELEEAIGVIRLLWKGGLQNHPRPLLHCRKCAIVHTSGLRPGARRENHMSMGQFPIPISHI